MTTCAPLPPGVPYGVVGPRMQAVLALLVGRFRLSRREAEEALVSLFGEKARVSLGWISGLEQRTSAALEGADREVADHVRQSPIVHADETSFRESPTPPPMREALSDAHWHLRRTWRPKDGQSAHCAQSA